MRRPGIASPSLVLGEACLAPTTAPATHFRRAATRAASSTRAAKRRPYFFAGTGKPRLRISASMSASRPRNAR